MTPRVSCLMVTRAGREELARKAVADWNCQTYPYAALELIVVADRPGMFLINDARVKVVPAPPGATIGALRQLSVEHASGDAVAIWDDDDGHHPNRLAVQMQAYEHADVVLLHQVTLVCLCGFKVLGRTRGWEPTMVVHRQMLPRYLDVAHGEDTAIVNVLWYDKSALFELIVAPELYEYRFHGGNACAVDHWQSMFAAVSTHDPWRCAAQRGLVKPEEEATLGEILARIERATDTPALARCSRALQFYFDHHPEMEDGEKVDAFVRVADRGVTLTRLRPLGDPSR